MYRKTRWGFTYLTIFVALCIWLLTAVKPQLGIDLQGGTELIYRLDLSHIAENPEEVANEVKDIIARRLNLYGLKEISIAVEGRDRMVVQLPGTDSASVESIKGQIEKAGKLSFRLVAESDEHARNMDRYIEEEAEYRAELLKWAAAKRAWAREKRRNPAFDQPEPVEPKPPEFIVREEVEKEIGEDGKEEWVGTGRRHVLHNRPGLYVDGSYLDHAAPSWDPDTLRNAVAFGFKGEGASLFGDLTGNHIDESLAILLDDDIMQVANIKSAITTNGQLTGDFSAEDVTGIVTILRGGSLRTKPQLDSESTVSSTLGRESIERGVLAVAIGLAVVMLVIAIYYLAAGLVANFAVAFNILVVVAYVACFRQTLTLPGIAGILLTIGMAVDANILIFERVREERKRGKALLQALTAGYQRAFSVIFDSNLTTIITGLVLFNFGTGPVKGFAVTLIAGIIVSFVSALFVTRLLLSLALNMRWLKQMKMLQAFETPRVPFVKFQRPFLLTTVAVIAVSWVLVVQRGNDNYGIDFTGGARIRVGLNKKFSTETMIERVGRLAARHPELFPDWSLQAIDRDADGRASEFAILTRAGSEFIKTANAQEAEAPEAAPAAAPETAPSAPPAGADDVVGDLEDEGDDEEAVVGAAQQVRTILEDEFGPDGLLLPEPFPRGEWQWQASGADQQSLVFEVNLSRPHPGLTPDRLETFLTDTLQKDERFQARAEGVAAFSGVRVQDVLRVQPASPDAEVPVDRYRIQLSPYTPPATPSDTSAPTKTQVETAVRDFFAKPLEKLDEGSWAEQEPPFVLSNPFPQVATVGPRVASDLQIQALVAIFISILGIVFYISLRFEFIFGLAAIAALVHDVLITIGVLALTDQFLGSVIPIKINLPEVAALLTIIGYSINDTIVVFDRIRENLRLHGKKKLRLRDCVDMSINQTLSRTLWTSATTLVTVLSLLILGGDAVRGFAYTFAVGLITGTYSSVFVASPVLIWLHERAERRRSDELASARA